jgi:hypothetical protein
LPDGPSAIAPVVLGFIELRGSGSS